MEELMDYDLLELIQLIQSGKVTPTQSIAACFARIKRLNPKLNAFVTLNYDMAMQQARIQEEKLKKGEKVGILCGIPLGVKDLEDAEGFITSYGCKVFANNVAKEDSVQVKRLKDHGAIVVGKTNVPIFGSQAFSHNDLYGTTRNPWNLQLTPGGSSGGSSAALAAKLCPLVTASDGGGSIRIPATFVGAFGMKPTYGRVPLNNLHQFQMTHFLHCVHFGPLTRSVEEAALILDITAGYHPSDPFSLPKPTESYLSLVRGGKLPKGKGKDGKLRVAFSRDLGYVSGCQTDIMRNVENALKVFTRLGHEVIEAKEIVLPDLGLSWALGMGVQEYHALINHLEGHLDLVDRSMRVGWEMSKNLTVSEISDIMREVFTLNKVLEDVFHKYDLLITPAMGIDPFPAAGPMTGGVNGKDFDSIVHAVGYNYPFNFSGHPACVLRCGYSDAKLPVGIQFVAERQQDGFLLQVAKLFEEQVKPFNIWPSKL